VPAPSLWINLSAAEALRADVAEQFVRDVGAAGLAMSDITIEITEELLLDSVGDRTLAQLGALRSLGARIALDDFGAGHCGLGHMLRLPCDILKLDRGFVSRLGQDGPGHDARGQEHPGPDRPGSDLAGPDRPGQGRPGPDWVSQDRRAEEIVRMTASLADALGILAVAEGVETAGQAEALRARGFDAVQGFMVARPMPPDAVAGWLAGRGGARVLPLALPPLPAAADHAAALRA
jgi:EAL domain-containing protein (putative c-di-GMP-specific phosphodiesterase class I)